MKKLQVYKSHVKDDVLKNYGRERLVKNEYSEKFFSIYSEPSEIVFVEKDGKVCLSNSENSLSYEKITKNNGSFNSVIIDVTKMVKFN